MPKRTLQPRVIPTPRWTALVRMAATGLVATASMVASAAWSAEVVPNEVQMPGTQPGETSQIQSVSKCDNCHGNFEPAGEPWFNWSGSMMAHASRDPIFWATVAVAEQDFDGAGDLCIRCHVPKGWMEGRSTPTDGSGLNENDANGVQCDVCHRLTNPDGSEHVGVQNAPFLAHDEATPPEPYLGSGIMVLYNGNEKLGPYADADATHQFLQSQFHRDAALCGTCHDVSNPAVGDLAPNNGAQVPLPPGSYSGVIGSPIEGKAAFNAFPHQYGVVERTYSEYMASAWPTTRVSDYDGLPAGLQDGAVQTARNAALLAGNGGDYADGTPRYFTCQTCHMPPTVGQGCNKNPPVRGDLPVHDLTGGNYWMPDAIQYLDAADALLLGGGLSQQQNLALDAGANRARAHLDEAARIDLVGQNTIRVVNLTGHKLISGYPEGRRMWLRIRWFDDVGGLMREDGAYGPLDVQIDGQTVTVETLLDLDGTNTRLYEAHPAMTQEWAAKLLSLGVSPGLALSYDRETGAVTKTLGDLGADPPGSHHETFHFVLNNTLAADTRIPPWGFRYDDARERNALPVPEDQYGDPGPGGVYDHWDEVALDPPTGAARATIELLYQPTSWEYVQFLHLANTGQVAHLADEGDKLLDAWLATGMAEPHVMDTAVLDPVLRRCEDGRDNDGDGVADWPDDPGCADAADDSERAAELVCDNGLDDDGDGAADYPADPGCGDPSWQWEAPACQDGADNDGDGFIDWDGGASAGVPAAEQTDPDPQCADAPQRNAEAKSSCGLGGELLGALVAWLGVIRLRRRGATDGAAPVAAD